MTVKLLENWLQQLHQKGRSIHTLNAYRRGVQHFIHWYEAMYDADFQLHLVMPRDIRNWKHYQQSTEKAKPATINQRLVALTRFFQWGQSQGLCQENPAADVSTIPLGIHQPKALKHKDALRLLRAARTNLRDYAIIELLLSTGLRVGELLALQINDLELNERSGKVIVRQGKGDSYRDVPLTVDVRKALFAYLEQEHPDPQQLDLPLWQSRNGWLKHRSSVTRLLNKYAQIAGIDDVNPHRLRHTFATRYLQANPDDLRGLARLLGHRDLNTVMIYTEPDMDDLTKRMERVEILG